MAQLVTRSMTTTTVTFKAADTTNDKLVEKTATLPRKVDSSKVLEVIKSSYDYISSGIIPVAVVSCKYNDKLYGMTQEEFFKHAKELDEKRKFIEPAPFADKPYTDTDSIHGVKPEMMGDKKKDVQTLYPAVMMYSENDKSALNALYGKETAKAEDKKPETAKAEDKKPETAKAEDKKPEKVKAEDKKPETVKGKVKKEVK